MLLDDDDEEVLQQTSHSVLSVMSAFLLGRAVGAKRPSSTFIPGSFTTLEEVYLTGKAVRLIGPMGVKNLSRDELAAYMSRANIPITEYDREKIRQLSSETEKWLQNRADEWRKNIRSEIAASERQWNAALGTEGTLGADAMAIARNSALENLLGVVAETTSAVQAGIDTLIQTEMANFFQQGQMSGVSQDEWVYKIPRMSACDECLRLHVDEDGEPTLYQLSEVQGNSNIGVPAQEWDFCIGPVHPHCYCILYTVADSEPKQSKALGERRGEVLKQRKARKSLQSFSLEHLSDFDSKFMDEVGKATGRIL